LKVVVVVVVVVVDDDETPLNSATTGSTPSSPL
jgi:hypothetical protein